MQILNQAVFKACKKSIQLSSLFCCCFFFSSIFILIFKTWRTVGLMDAEKEYQVALRWLAGNLCADLRNPEKVLCGDSELSSVVGQHLWAT